MNMWHPIKSENVYFKSFDFFIKINNWMFFYCFYDCKNIYSKKNTEWIKVGNMLNLFILVVYVDRWILYRFNE